MNTRDENYKSPLITLNTFLFLSTKYEEIGKNSALFRTEFLPISSFAARGAQKLSSLEYR